MKNTITKTIVTSLLSVSLLMPFVGALSVSADMPPANWNVTGNYVIDQHYNGTDNPVAVSLSQDGSGAITGNGTSGDYAWVIDSGSVSGDNVNFTAHYTATADAVTPLTVLTVSSVVAQDGTMSGTWSDNYQASDRTGAWTTTSGNAVILVNNTMTVAATDVVSNDATLNGMSGNAASGYSFWVSLAPFDTSSTTLPANVYSTADFGAIAANTSFSAALSSISGILPITASTAYYFAAWSDINGTWNPGAVMNFTTTATGSVGSGQIGGDVTQANGILGVTSVTMTKATSTADGTFAGGWKYVFHVTLPTSEPKLAMKFSDWVNGVDTSIIPVANNMRISSTQADNAGATVLLTSANVYSAPSLNIVADLDPSTPGIQADIAVEVSIPVGTAAHSYTTSYGIQTTP